MLELRLLGSLEVFFQGEAVRFPTQKSALLLAYLVTFRDRAHPRSALAERFWGEAPPQRANNSLRNALTALRKCLAVPEGEPPYLITTVTSVRFNESAPFELDTQALDAALSQAGELTPRAAEALEAALALYRGPFLAECYEDWAVQEQRYWQDRFLEGTARLSEHYERQGRPDRAIPLIRRALGFYPLHEPLCRALMRAYALSGDRPAALEHYRAFARQLQEEMGLEPLPETQILYEQILDNRLVSRRGAEPQPAPSVPSRPAFVGREAFFERLWRRWEAVRAGALQVLLVKGDAGLGKSACLREAIERLEPKGAFGLSVSCPPTATAPLEPLVRALKGQSEVQSLMKTLPPSLRAGLWSDADKASAEWELPPDRRQLQRFRALCALLAALAERGPVCLAIDDLHWADESTVQWLHYAAYHLRASVLILGSYRPTERDRAPSLTAVVDDLAARGVLETWELPPLPHAQAVELLKRWLPEVLAGEKALVERVIRLAGGNPFFLGELAKGLTESGLKAPLDPDWGRRLVRHLPQSLQAALNGRLRRLSAQALRLLEVGSVLGPDWSFSLAARVCEQRRAVLLDAVRELLGVYLLVEREGAYAFRHELIREVLYRRLPLAQRQYLHERAGLALEEDRTLGNASPALLAWHFERAARPDKALPHLLTAVLESVQANALDEALALLARADEAFAQWPSDEETLSLGLHLHAQRARVHALRNDLDGQRAAVEALEELARASGSPVAWLWAHLHRSYWAQLAERYEEALEQAEALRVLAEREGDATFQAAALRQRSRLRERRGEYVPALADQRQATELAPDLPAVVAGVPLPDRTGVLHSYLGQFDRALAHYTEQQAKLGSSDPFVQIDLALNLGITLEHLGDHQGAIAHYRRGHALAAQLEDRRTETVFLTNLGSAWWGAGDFPRALDHFARALSRLEGAEDLRVRLAVTINLGTVHADMGAFARAFACFDGALEAVRAHGMRDLEAEIHWRAAAALLALDKPQAALRRSRRALALIEEGATLQYPAWVHFVHAQALEANGQQQAARRALQRAYDEVMARAERIEHEALKRSFLEHIRYHREILARWRA